MMNGEAMSKEETGQGTGDFDQLKQDISNLKQQLADLVKHAATASSGVAGNLKDKAMDSVEDVKNIVSKRPLTSIVVAFGVGYLLSRLLRKS